MSPVAGYGIGRCDAHRTLYGHWELHKECLDVKGPNLHLAGDKLFRSTRSS